MDPSQSSAPVNQSISGWLFALTWGIVVPGVAVIALVMLINNRPAFPARVDVIYGGAVVLAPLLRGASLMLEDASISAASAPRGQRWARYCLVYVGGAAALWLVARGLVMALDAMT